MTRSAPRLRTIASRVVWVNAVIGFANLATNIWFARQLGPSELGNYASVVVAIELLFCGINAGFNQPIIRSPDDVGLVRAAHAGVLLQACCLLVLCVLAGAAAIAAGWGSWHQWTVIGGILVVAKSLSLLTTLHYARAESAMRYHEISNSQLISSAVGICAGLLMLSQTISLFALLARDVTTCTILFALVRRQFGALPKPDFTRAGLDRIFRSARALWALNFLESLTVRLDYAIVAAFLGKEMLGIYYTIRGVSDGVLSFFLKPIQTVVYAHYCQLANLNHLVPMFRTWTGVVSIAIAIVLIIFPAGEATTIVSQLWGEQFAAGAVMIPAMLAYVCATMWFENLKVFAMARDRHAQIVASRYLQLAFLLTGGVALISVTQLSGAAWATATSAYILCATAAVRTLEINHSVSSN